MPRLAKLQLRLLVEFWTERRADVRLQAFIAIYRWDVVKFVFELFSKKSNSKLNNNMGIFFFKKNRMATELPFPFVELALKGSYLAFVRVARHVTPQVRLFVWIIYYFWKKIEYIYIFT